MTRSDALSALAKCREELHAQFGVKSLSLFGSVARDEADDQSDIDLLVEFDRPTGYFVLFTLQDHLEKLLGVRVDIGTRLSLKPRIRESINVA